MTSDLIVPERLHQVPQGATPDEAGAVRLRWLSRRREGPAGVVILGVMLGVVQGSQSGRAAAVVVRDVEPLGQAGIAVDRPGQEIAEPLSHRPGLFSRGGAAEAPARHLIVLNSVAVLVHDDIGVLTGVGAPRTAAGAGISEVEPAVDWIIERVAIVEVVSVGRDGVIQDVARAAEAQRLYLPLHRVNVAVDHDLLKAIIAAGIDIAAAGLISLPRRFVGARNPRRRQVHKLTLELVLSRLDTQESPGLVLPRQQRFVGRAVAVRRGRAAATLAFRRGGAEDPPAI